MRQKRPRGRPGRCWQRGGAGFRDRAGPAQRRPGRWRTGARRAARRAPVATAATARRVARATAARREVGEEPAPTAPTAAVAAMAVWPAGAEAALDGGVGITIGDAAAAGATTGAAGLGA